MFLMSQLENVIHDERLASLFDAVCAHHSLAHYNHLTSKRKRKPYLDVFHLE